MLTGPKASISCAAEFSGSWLSNNIGDINAPESLLASTTSTVLALPYTNSLCSCSLATAVRTPSRCLSPASAPMRTVSLSGLPTVTFASLADNASATASIRLLGTIARRIEVHF